MDSPKASCDGANDSGVTSRSGRVIKKSTKLIDFTSPDDIEAKKAKKMAAQSRKLDKHYNDEQNYDEEYSMKKDSYNPDHDEMELEDDDFNESDSDEQQVVIKTEDDPEIEFITPKKSIYITEKSSKKKMIKDGKIVMGKAQRKDKGKTRYTAYMLWAKEARHQISNSNPEMDFASVSKRLGEMWANVPTNVKYNWKRRAKRLANKMKKSNGAKGVSQQQPSKYMQQKYYLNKGSTNNGNNNSGISPSSSSNTTALTKQQKQLQKLLKCEKTKTQSIQNVQRLQKEKQSTSQHANINSSPTKISMVPSTSSSSSSSRNVNSINSNRPMDLAPIDVAAHLKLLGESLINIGERLSQHEGQIAVSGSFSVLLDSILCSMGALMCCMLYVPELNIEANQLTTTTQNNNSENSNDDQRNIFQSIMDNIHYIMPGL